MSKMPLFTRRPHSSSLAWVGRYHLIHGPAQGLGTTEDDFSQLSEFERGLIIGMKTAGWSTRRVAGQVDRSECTVRNCWKQWTREGTHAWKTGSGATTRREDRAASTCGPHSDSLNDTSRRRRSNCSTNNFQTPFRSKS
ncbi:transposable element Tcb2 transposase [Trichonephila clavipes]|nr:transposable element Tcb2 transposase [Trichonephila clavipes]